MAAIDTTHAPVSPAGEGFLGRILTALHLTQEERARRIIYRQTVRELSALSNRDLADLGISRGGIRAAAYQAVYHA